MDVSNFTQGDVGSVDAMVVGWTHRYAGTSHAWPQSPAGWAHPLACLSEPPRSSEWHAYAQPPQQQARSHATSRQRNLLRCAQCRRQAGGGSCCKFSSSLRLPPGTSTHFHSPVHILGLLRSVCVSPPQSLRLFGRESRRRQPPSPVHPAPAPPPAPSSVMAAETPDKCVCKPAPHACAGVAAARGAASPCPLAWRWTRAPLGTRFCGVCAGTRRCPWWRALMGRSGLPTAWSWMRRCLMTTASSP